jgi:hypothetical protein
MIIYDIAAILAVFLQATHARAHPSGGPPWQNDLYHDIRNLTSRAVADLKSCVIELSSKSCNSFQSSPQDTVTMGGGSDGGREAPAQVPKGFVPAANCRAPTSPSGGLKYQSFKVRDAACVGNGGGLYNMVSPPCLFPFPSPSNRMLTMS